MDDYPPPPRRGPYDDPYRGGYAPPVDPYMARGPYDRPPVREFGMREGGYPREYDRRY